MSMTRDDWLAALHDTGIVSKDDDPSAITIGEFADLMGINRTTAAFRLDALVAAGRAILTAKSGVNSYGRHISYRAYRLIQP